MVLRPRLNYRPLNLLVQPSGPPQEQPILVSAQCASPSRMQCRCGKKPCHRRETANVIRDSAPGQAAGMMIMFHPNMQRHVCGTSASRLAGYPIPRNTPCPLHRNHARVSCHPWIGAPAGGEGRAGQAVKLTRPHLAAGRSRMGCFVRPTQHSLDRTRRHLPSRSDSVGKALLGSSILSAASSLNTCSTAV